MRGLVLLLLLMPALAFAGESGEANKFIWSIHGNYIIDFIVGVGLMWWLLAPTIKRYFKDRSEQVKAALDEAEGALRQAEAKLDEYKAHMANIQAEIDELLASYRAKGEQEKQAAMHEAVAAAERLKRQAEARVALAQAEMSERVRGNVVNLAVDAIVDALKKQGGIAPTAKLIDRFIKEMEAL